MQDSIYEKAIEYLEKDVLLNLVPLKYLTEYKDAALIQLIESKSAWALLFTIPTNILSHDSEMYP